jgi:hypothetical protein
VRITPGAFLFIRSGKQRRLDFGALMFWDRIDRIYKITGFHPKACGDVAA